MDAITASARCAIAASLAALAACTLQPAPDALQLPPDAAAARVRQTRHFDGVPEPRILAAGTAVLQDLGFTIDEAEAGLGLLVASKERSAINEAEVAGAYLVAVLSWLALVPDDPVYASRQTVRVALVTSPAKPGAAAATTVRITIQRAVLDNNDQVRRVERVDDDALYQQFFERLSQSVFLEVESP